MTSCYVELRKNAARGTESMAADVMRHLHTRQHLGKAVVVCDNPIVLLSAARKQWLKLARTIQKQRSSTLNADKILKYTHMIAHMQRMFFSAKAPLDQPAADIYFLKPSQVAIMPIHCWTVYILTDIPPDAARDMLRLLPSDALVVDYTHIQDWQQLGLQPKETLEQQVTHEWQRVRAFLRSYDVDIGAVWHDDMTDVEAMDNALDTLLGVSHKFLGIANEFQRTLELARPLKLGKQIREQYDTLALLAHRVQALSPGAFTQQFLEVYNEDDTFFLYDLFDARQLAAAGLAERYHRHQAAGRYRLAQALQRVAELSGANHQFAVTIPAILVAAS